MEFYNFNRLKHCVFCETKCAYLIFVTDNVTIERIIPLKRKTELKDAYLLCAKCLSDLETKKQKSLLEKDLSSKLFVINNMAKHVQKAIDDINAKGYIMKKNAVNDFRETVCSNIDESVKKFDNYLSVRLAKYDYIGSYQDNSRYGMVYYQKDIFNEQFVTELYALSKENRRLKEQISSLEKNPSFNTKDIQKMIETQTKL